MKAKGKHVDDYTDRFGKEVLIGDTIIFYSGNTGQFEVGVVKLIYEKSGYYHDCRITLESGSVINSRRLTMKYTKEMQ